MIYNYLEILAVIVIVFLIALFKIHQKEYVKIKIN